MRMAEYHYDSLSPNFVHHEWFMLVFYSVLLMSHPQAYDGMSLRILTKSRVRTGGVQGNQIHTITVWVLRIPKMCIRTPGYNVLVLH